MLALNKNNIITKIEHILTMLNFFPPQNNHYRLTGTGSQPYKYP